jgi:hypothetical protein
MAPIGPTKAYARPIRIMLNGRVRKKEVHTRPLLVRDTEGTTFMAQRNPHKAINRTTETESANPDP